MVNPVATLVFDLFLIGSAAGLLTSIAVEAFTARKPTVGNRTAPPAPAAVVARPAKARRRSAMRRNGQWAA